MAARLATDHKIALFLDYDGTLSEITPDVDHARPLPGAAHCIARLAESAERFRVILISGRQAQRLAELVGVSQGITFVGNHGLEILEPDGSSRMVVDPAQFMPALDAVRAWVRVNIPAGKGFVIEDKGFSIALHYRLAPAVLALKARLRLREFVRKYAPPLVTGEGKLVIEAMPRQANKGDAVAMLTRGWEGWLPVYFGDDLTDEDAFLALRETGVTVKVSAETVMSWARYRVASPKAVVDLLAEMAAACLTA